jgi:hypothetical protein
MARNWRRVALAAIAAATLAGIWASDVAAQAKQPDGEQEAEAESKVPPKKKKQDPAEAQRGVDAATKLLQAGKTEPAVQSLTGILNVGNLPPSVMAKALYVRGVAYRQQSKPAQAISDLTSALWLKGGLNETDRTEALKQRSGAYTDAGLTEAGEPLSVAAKERPNAPGKGWGAVTSEPASAPPLQPPSGGGWFQNLFGASASPAKAPEPQQAPAPPKETASIERPAAPQPAAGPAPRISKAWTSNTQVDREAPAVVPTRRPPAAAPPPVAAKPAGKYRVQLATVLTQEEAKALEAKAQREHAAVLESREAEIDQAVLGNMGSFYRLRFGPYATVQEAQAVCAKLKGSGFDCMSVTP